MRDPVHKTQHLRGNFRRIPYCDLRKDKADRKIPCNKDNRYHFDCKKVVDNFEVYTISKILLLLVQR